MIRTCSYPRDHRGVLLAGWAVLWIAFTPHAAWGQWSTTNPVYTYSNAGIGTMTPAAPLHVINNWAEVRTESGPYGFAWFTAKSDTGDWEFAAPGSTTPWGSTTPGQGNAYIFQRVDNGGYFRMFFNGQTGNIGIGTINPGSYRLAVEGNIGARDIIVTSAPWSDHVFRPDYRLRPLSEVGAFIQKHRHLPDIPTEAEVKEKGVSLGDMQAKLLAKVEELTLHMIQQDKDHRELRENLTRENQELRDRLVRLEKGAAADSTPAAAK